MPTGPRPPAAVVVVNWNGAAVLGPCLRSLAPEVADTGAEVVVVDNASTDGSADLVPLLLPGARVVRRDRNDGFAAAVNAGVRATDAPVVLLLNNDAVALPGWVAAMTAPFAEDPRLGATTGLVLLDGALAPVGEVPTASPAADGGFGEVRGHDGSRWRRVPPGTPGGRTLVNSTGNEMTRSGNGRDRGWLTSADAPPADPDVLGLNGGCAALRRAALDDVGPLEESLFLYYEDTELSWRLRRRGWGVRHVPDGVTVHRHASSSGTASRVFVTHNARNRLSVAVRHAPWPVVARAWVRTAVRTLRGPHRRWWAAALVDAARCLPADVRARRAVDRTATIPRREVARLLVPDS